MEPALFGKLLSAILASAAPVQDAAPEPIELRYVPPEELEIELPPVLASPQEWAEVCEPWDDWEKPAPPFIVAPGTVYVGTCGIAALLVVTNQGNVLIDTGTRGGAELVYSNIQQSGADPSAIELILTSHEHFDHVGGVAWMQRQTRAPVAALPAAAQVIRTGKEHPEDPQFGMHGDMEPSPFVITAANGEPMHVGEVTFTPIATPGHTPGATSWHWEVCRGGACTSIVYADSMSPVSRDDYRFSDHPEYVAQYRAGIARLAAIDCDILLTPHPSHSQMIERAATGTFENGPTCEEYAARKERDLNARLEREAGGDQ